MLNKKDELIYLAAPYSHEDVSIRKERIVTVNKVAACLLLKGNLIYSPLSETVVIAESSNDLKDTTWEFWRKKDIKQLSCCDELWILTLEGWEHSKGVRAEIKFAIKNNIKIAFLYENEIDNVYYPIIPHLLTRYLNVKSVEELND